MPGSSRAFWLGWRLWLEVGLVIVAIVLHVIHRSAIAFFESVAEVVASLFALDRRMFICVVIIRVGMVVIGVVISRSFHAFVKAAAFGVLVLVRRPIPIVITVLILCGAGCRLRFDRARLHRGWSHNTEGKRGN